jgi:ParB/RepB/Spo0J family partition protein
MAKRKKAAEVEAESGAVAVAERSADMPAARAVREIEIDAILPSELNRKIDEDSQQLLELAESIQAEGLIQPIVVRPSGDKYEIVCGERRWRAARKLCWAKIPAIVEECDDRRAQVLRLVENLQRQDVSPLEQSAGVAVLLEDCDGNAGEVGKRLGQTEAWVRVRARLRDLAPEWRQELADPETAYERLARFVGWQEQVAKLPAETQELLWRERKLLHARNESELREAIGRCLRRLADAPWLNDQDAESNLTGLDCRRCVKRTDRDGLLFADMVSDPDDAVCLDPLCWQKHLDVWLIKRLRWARKMAGEKSPDEHPGGLVVISESCWIPNNFRKDVPADLRILTGGDWLPAEAGEDEDERVAGDERAAFLEAGWLRGWGIFLEGDRAGEVLEIIGEPPEVEDEDADADPADADNGADETCRKAAAKEREFSEWLDRREAALERIQNHLNYTEEWPSDAMRKNPILAACACGVAGLEGLANYAASFKPDAFLREINGQEAEHVEDLFWCGLRESLEKDVLPQLNDESISDEAVAALAEFLGVED